MAEITTSARDRAEYMARRLPQKVKSLEGTVEHLNAQHRVMRRNLTKIFGIWNAWFKTLGVIVSFVIATVVTCATRTLYYDDGTRWSFSMVFFGGVIYLIVLALGIWVTWILTNTFLIKKIELCNGGGEDE